MNIVTFIQARKASTRLPGKVDLSLGGKTVIMRVQDAAEMIKDSSDTWVIWAEDFPEYLGTLSNGRNDVLGRYAQALRWYEDQDTKVDAIIRLTGDCPLMDPQVADLVVAKFIEERADYCSNVFPRRTFPDGLDVEVFRTEALESAHQLSHDPYEREHVTPWMQAHCSRISSVELPVDWSRVRLTLDTPEDYSWLCSVIQAPLNP